MSVLDKVENITISGKEYGLKYTFKAITMAEKELVKQNVFAAIAQNVLGLGDAFVLFKWGLIGNGGKYNPAEIDKLFGDCIDENGMDGLQMAIINGLIKSGYIVAKEKRKNILAPVQMEPTEQQQQ